MTTEETLNSIKPGKNYPASVTITEEIEGKNETVRFLLQSYIVGMYCAIHWPGVSEPSQNGDHNNRTFVGKLKRDIKSAIERGATVEFGSILPIKTSMRE